MYADQMFRDLLWFFSIVAILLASIVGGAWLNTPMPFVATLIGLAVLGIYRAERAG